jgi:putative transposase
MPSRKVPLITNEYYHIYNRGFNQQQIFLSTNDYQRVFETIRYYQYLTPPIKFSYLNIQPPKQQKEILSHLVQTSIDILAFCFMPNHFHFLVKQVKDSGINLSISKFSLSYSRYFNIINEKKGPVFEGRFKAVKVSSNEQLLHLSRYIHLNPFTASIVKDIHSLQDYPYSSLKEYMHPQRFNLAQTDEILAQFKSTQKYLEFTLDHAEHQKQLGLIKSISID